MKVLILALWTYCMVGQPAHAIVVPDLPTCERLGPAVTEELRRLEGGWGGYLFSCRFQEEPYPEEDCGGT